MRSIKKGGQFAWQWHPNIAILLTSCVFFVVLHFLIYAVRLRGIDKQLVYPLEKVS